MDTADPFEVYRSDEKCNDKMNGIEETNSIATEYKSFTAAPYASLMTDSSELDGFEELVDFPIL